MRDLLLFAGVLAIADVVELRAPGFVGERDLLVLLLLQNQFPLHFNNKANNWLIIFITNSYTPA